jgi:predicted GIY-YIG superfamily endonuclease
MFFVCIIHFSKLDSYYIGTTDDVVERVNEHIEVLYKGAIPLKEYLGFCF